MQSAEPMKLDMDKTNWWEIEGKCIFQFLLNRNPYKCWQSFVQRELTCEKSCWNVSFYVSHVLQIKDFSFFFIITREWWLIRWMRLTDSIKHISRISWCGTRYQLWEWNSCVRISSFSVDFLFFSLKRRKIDDVEAIATLPVSRQRKTFFLNVHCLLGEFLTPIKLCQYSFNYAIIFPQ